MSNISTIKTRLLAGISGFLLVVLCAACAMEPQLADVSTHETPASEVAAGYIVQAETIGTAKEAVEAVGGQVTHELGIIRAVGTTLSPAPGRESAES